MLWWGARLHLAIECSPVEWTCVVAKHRRGQGPELATTATFDASSPVLSQKLRQWRLSERVPSGAGLVLWPEPGDHGVVSIDERPRGVVSLPKARVIRERMAPFVKAGGHVREVLLPHEAAAHLAERAGWSSACVIVMAPSMACAVVIDGGGVQASYVTWTSTPDAGTESQRLLARYQFAARLVPHVRVAANQVPSAPVAVCGRYPDLRSAMVPMVEEFDRELEVLDGALVGLVSDATLADPDDVCGQQLAWSVAANH